MPALTTRLVFSPISPVWVWPSRWRMTVGTASGHLALGHLELLDRNVLGDIVPIERGGVEQPHLRTDLADLEAPLLQFDRVGVLQHDLVAALAMNLVGDDVQVEELHLLIRELVFVAQGRRLAAVDRGHLRFETDHKTGRSE